MRTRIAFGLVGALVLILAAGRSGADEIDGAQAAARRYSEAHMRLDVDAVVGLSHPIMVLRAGGTTRFRQTMEEMYRSFAGLGFEKGAEQLGSPSDMFVDGKTRMVGFPAIRKTPGSGTVAIVYVVASYDGGKTWTVLALTCTDEHWLRALAPRYGGVPDILGIANPAARKMMDNQNFDESLYLQGPRWKNWTK